MLWRKEYVHASAHNPRVPQLPGGEERKLLMKHMKTVAKMPMVAQSTSDESAKLQLLGSVLGAFSAFLSGFSSALDVFNSAKHPTTT